MSEIAIAWHSAAGGMIYDPMAGDPERGIVAGTLNRRYVGIELREEQVDHNQGIADDLDLSGVRYVLGNGRDAATLFPDESADMLFACPPYWNLEHYSDDPDDISNMTWEEFTAAHSEIIQGSVDKLADNRFAVWVVGDMKDKKTGRYMRLRDSTIDAFEAAGAPLHNDIILIRQIGSTARFARRAFVKEEARA